jgi:hypothetical protein
MQEKSDASLWKIQVQIVRAYIADETAKVLKNSC